MVAALDRPDCLQLVRQVIGGQGNEPAKLLHYLLRHDVGQEKVAAAMDDPVAGGVKGRSRGTARQPREEQVEGRIVVGEVLMLLDEGFARAGDNPKQGGLETDTVDGAAQLSFLGPSHGKEGKLHARRAAVDRQYPPDPLLIHARRPPSR